MGTLGGFPAPPALRLRRAVGAIHESPGSAYACAGGGTVPGGQAPCPSRGTSTRIPTTRSRHSAPTARCSTRWWAPSTWRPACASSTPAAARGAGRALGQGLPGHRVLGCRPFRPCWRARGRAAPGRAASPSCRVTSTRCSREAGGFDRVASVNVIWTLPNPRGSLARMTAGLRPGGHMVHTTPRLRFRADVIVWRHLRAQTGWALLRALLGLPILLVAGLLNLLLVARSALHGGAPRARRRWSEEGLLSLLREAGAEPSPVRPCYAGQGYLLVAGRAAAGHVIGHDK